MIAPQTETICRTVAGPCGPGACAATGAGLSTTTASPLLNGVLTQVDFTTEDFEEPPATADAATDRITVGVGGAYIITFSVVYGATLDPGAQASAFIFVNGAQAAGPFVHPLGAALSTQLVTTPLALSPSDFVELFVRQDGALEGVTVQAAALSVFLGCSAP